MFVVLSVKLSDNIANMSDDTANFFEPRLELSLEMHYIHKELNLPLVVLTDDKTCLLNCKVLYVLQILSILDT